MSYPRDKDIINAPVGQLPPAADRHLVGFTFDGRFTNGNKATVRWVAQLRVPEVPAADWRWFFDCAAESLRIGIADRYSVKQVGWTACSEGGSGWYEGAEIAKLYLRGLSTLAGRPFEVLSFAVRAYSHERDGIIMAM